VKEREESYSTWVQSAAILHQQVMQVMQIAQVAQVAQVIAVGPL